MDIEDLLGKHIQAATICPDIDAIFLLNHDRGMCVLQADDTQTTGTAIARFVSVKGAKNLYDATVRSVGGKQAPVEKANGENFRYTETHIDTDKGRCTITTALIRGEPQCTASLIVLPYDGYPPLTNFHLVDFARTAIPEQLHGTAICADKPMRSVPQAISETKGRKPS